MEIPVLNQDFDATSSMSIPWDLSPGAINAPLIHQVVKATLSWRRQGNASTKTKGLVSGGGIKPMRQKGTGRARQGSIRSPLKAGGGTVFGPMPRDHAQKVNKKMMAKAIQGVLADKFQGGKLFVAEGLELTGKTKEAFEFFGGRGLWPVLVVVGEGEGGLRVIRALRNLPRAKGLSVWGFSVYEAIKYENLVMEKSALEKLVERVSPHAP